MPVPIIEIQRRLAKAGEIRMGGEKQPNKPGAKLDAWRVTTPRESLAEQTAKLYGGEVLPWQSPSGPAFQVYTETAELPVLVMPGYSLKQTYELWEGATKRLRLCDGTDEELSGGPCICNAEGVDRCDIYARLTLVLPELDTQLGWQLITKGANAAHELPGSLWLIEAQSGGASFVRAVLRIDQRRGVKDGQVVRFVVPVLDLPVGYAALAAAASVPALAPANGAPATYTPIAPSASSGLDEALQAVSGPRSAAMGGNQPDMPRPTVEDFAPTPAPTPDVPADAPVEPQPEPPVEPQTKAATVDQKKKLNVLVGKLRDGGHLTNERIYNGVAQRRGTGGMDLAMAVGGYDAEGGLHWSPLRDSLTRAEAHWLIESLTEAETKLKQKGVLA